MPRQRLTRDKGMMQTCGQPEVTEAVVICSFTAFTSAVLSIEGLFRAAAESEPAEIANRRLSMMLANPLMQGSTGFANHLATLYRLAQETTQQVGNLLYMRHNLHLLS